MGTKLCHMCTERYPHHPWSKTYCADYSKGEEGEGDAEKRTARGIIHHKLFQKSITSTAQRYSSLPVRNYVPYNTPIFGSLETDCSTMAWLLLFSFGTAVSDQEGYNCTFTTSLLSMSCPCQLLPVTTNGSPLEAKEITMVAFKEAWGHRESTSSSGMAAARNV